MASALYERLPTVFNWQNQYVVHKTEILTAVDLMTKYDKTDDVQLTNLEQKVTALKDFIGRAEQELESLEDPPVCGTSRQKARRYSLCGVETLVFLAGICMIGASYATSGVAVDALKISGAVISLFSKFASSGTSIYFGNSDENKSKRQKDIESVVKDKSFLRLAQATLKEVKQAFAQISNAHTASAVTNRSIFNADRCISDLQEAMREPNDRSAPPSFMNYARTLRYKLYHGDARSQGSDFMVALGDVDD